MSLVNDGRSMIDMGAVYVSGKDADAWVAAGGGISAGPLPTDGFILVSPPAHPVPIRLALAWLEAGGWIWDELGDAIIYGVNKDGVIVAYDLDGNIDEVSDAAVICYSLETKKWFCCEAGLSRTRRRLIESRHEMAELEAELEKE